MIESAKRTVGLLLFIAFLFLRLHGWGVAAATAATAASTSSRCWGRPDGANQLVHVGLREHLREESRVVGLHFNASRLAQGGDLLLLKISTKAQGFRKQRDRNEAGRRNNVRNARNGRSRKDQQGGCESVGRPLNIEIARSSRGEPRRPAEQT
jgi:hypothetical protein